MSIEDSKTELVGKLLENRYRVTKTLGAGGMGDVHLAIDEKLGRKVAIKIPHTVLLTQQGFRERFQRELQSLIRLDHPRIVKVHDVGEHDETPFAVLQYLAGGSLRDQQKNRGGGARLAEVVPWLTAVADGLDFLHDAGVIHRDIKPENILFDENGNAFLADFGIAKLLGSADTGLTLTGMTPGTPFYMAPEVMTDTSVTPAYDQYGLGTMVYEDLVGARPFEGDTPMRLLYLKAREQPEPIGQRVPNLPPSAADAIMRTLDAEPGKRFNTCTAFANKIAESVTTPIVVPATTQATKIPLEPDRVTPTAATPQRRRRTAAWLGASLLLVGAAIGAAYVFAPDPDGPVLRKCYPVSESTVEDDVVKVSGDTDMTLRSATVGSHEAVVMGQSFSVDRFPVPEGGISVEIALEGTNGGKSTFPYRLSRAAAASPTAVTIEVQDLAANATVAAHFTIVATASRPLTSATVDGDPAVLSADKLTLKRDLHFDESGPQTIVIEAQAGDEPPIRHEHRVTVDTNLAAVVLDPQDGAMVGKAVKVKGTAAMQLKQVLGPGQVTVDGKTFEAELTVPRSGLSTSFTLVDTRGAKTTIEYRLRRKQIAAWSIEQLHPAAGAKVGGAFSVRIRSAEPVSWASIAGQEGRELSGGSELTFDLKASSSGSKTFELELERRSDGALAKSDVVVMVDVDAPELLGSSPAEGSTVDRTFTVRGTANEELAEARINGQPATPEDRGKSFSRELTVGEGEHTIAIELIDKVGNRKVYQRKVKRVAAVAQARKPDRKKPDPAKPNPTKPDPAKPGPAKPDPTKPGPTKPDPTKSANPQTNPKTDPPETKPTPPVVRPVVATPPPSVPPLFRADYQMETWSRKPDGTLSKRSRMTRRVGGQQRVIRVPAGERLLVEPKEDPRLRKPEEFKKCVDDLRHAAVWGLRLDARLGVPVRPVGLLVNLPNLEHLELANLQLTDADAEVLGKLTGLRHLTIRGGVFTDAAAEKLEPLKNLVSLTLIGPRFARGTGYDALAKLESLEELHLERAANRPEWIAKLVGLAKLRKLTLNQVRLHPQHLDFFRMMAALEELRIERGGVTRAQIEKLSLKLKVLEVK